MTRDRSFVIIKPDAVHRGLVGDIIGRFEKKGLKLVGMRLLHMTREQAERQYAVHREKPFYQRLVRFMTSSPCVVICLEGDHALEIVRMIVGATDPMKAAPGSIRGDHSVHITHNLIHASDCLESLQAELPIFFGPGDLVEYPHALENWFYLREQ